MEKSEAFSIFTCSAYTTIQKEIIDIKTDISNIVPYVIKRSVNTTPENYKDAYFTSTKEDKLNTVDNDTLELDIDASNTTTGKDDVETNIDANVTTTVNGIVAEVSQSKLIFSKSESDNSNGYNVRCSLSYNGKDIWSGSLLGNMPHSVSRNVSDSNVGTIDSMTGNISEAIGMYWYYPVGELIKSNENDLYLFM